jgi:hypothetical protein
MNLNDDRIGCSGLRSGTDLNGRSARSKFLATVQAPRTPAHWSSFEEVRRAYELAIECGYIEFREKGKPIQRIPLGGVGFVFDNQPDEDGFVLAGIDFDEVVCRGKGIASFAAERVKRIASYYEASVSRTGLHVIVKTYPLTRGIAHNGIELYTGGRFFTMTGRTPSNTPGVIAAPAEFAALANELRSQAATPGPDVDNFSRELRSGDGKLELDEFESAALFGGLTQTPFRDYHVWRDFMFACAHAELTVPDQVNRIRQLFAEVSAQAGGCTANNDELYDNALRATADKLARHEAIIIARTIVAKARTHGWNTTSTGIPETEQIYYVPGNEMVCREALDRVVAATPRHLPSATPW